MKCEIVRDLLPLYADGLVSEVTRASIEAHTAQCHTCREIMRKMCAPVEPEPHDEVLTMINGLKRQKRKIRNRIILACVMTALVFVLGWWVYMETRFVTRQSVVVETDRERILQERPELALTTEEKELSDLILEFPVIRENIGEGDAVVIPISQVPEEVKEILPNGAELTEVVVFLGPNVTVDYCWGDIRVIMEYMDPNRDGEIDLIRKTIGVHLAPDTQEADAVYVVEYVIALDRAWYQKIVSEHVWFSFLQMP